MKNLKLYINYMGTMFCANNFPRIETLIKATTKDFLVFAEMQAKLMLSKKETKVEPYDIPLDEESISLIVKDINVKLPLKSKIDSSKVESIGLHLLTKNGLSKVPAMRLKLVK